MIAQPVSYSPDDLAFVEAFERLAPENQLAEYWSHDELTGLRSRVKTHYIAAQSTRCCYCNNHLRTEHHRVWDAEHIVPRAKRPHFMFTPRNLAASCLDCNNAKGETQVLMRPAAVRYPQRSAAFKIIHPHFDDYDDHIRKIGHVYLPKTDKGRKTIYICDLMRFAQKYIDWKNSPSDESFEKDVEAVFAEEPGASEAAVARIVSQLPEQ